MIVVVFILKREIGAFTSDGFGVNRNVQSKKKRKYKVFHCGFNILLLK